MDNNEKNSYVQNDKKEILCIVFYTIIIFIGMAIASRFLG